MKNKKENKVSRTVEDNGKSDVSLHNQSRWPSGYYALLGMNNGRLQRQIGNAQTNVFTQDSLQQTATGPVLKFMGPGAGLKSGAS